MEVSNENQKNGDKMPAKAAEDRQPAAERTDVSATTEAPEKDESEYRTNSIDFVFIFLIP